MIIETLALQNFMGYRKRVELDLSGRPVVGIVGANESGKSTLLKAICYALFGKVPMTYGDAREVSLLNDHADGDMLVRLGVRMPDGSRFEVERGRTVPGGSPIVRATGGAGKASEQSEHIANTIGVGYADFIALSYFVQGDLHQFMAGNKREYFQRWTASLAVWDRLERAALSWLKELEDRKRKLTGDITALEATVGGLDSARRDREAARAGIAEAERRSDIAQTQVAKLTEQVAAHRSVHKVHARISELTARSSAVRQTLANLDRRARLLEGEIESVGRGECPVLSASIRCAHLVAEARAKRKDLTAELDGVTRDKKALAREQCSLEKKLQALSDRADSGAAVSEARRALSAARSDASQAKADLARHHQRAARAALAVTAVVSARRRIKDAKAELDSLDAEIREVQFLRWMCGREGVPLDLVECELEAVQDKCNWVLARLGYAKQVRFSSYRELAAPERVCPVCGGEEWYRSRCRGCDAERPRMRRYDMTVSVLDGQVERPFALESGGAQVLQSFAVRLACGLFRAALTGHQSQMILLDEVFAMLDAANRQRLLNLVIDKLQTEFGLRQQLIVSHHEDVLHAVDDLLVVGKSRGGTTATWA